MSGPLPAEWSSMSSLLWLSMACNHMSGKLPPQWQSMPAIERADLSCQRGNGFSGGMPPTWRRYCATKPLVNLYIGFTWCVSKEVCAEKCALGGASSYPSADSCILPKGIKDTRLPSNETF
jgi:hypothetical protein